MSHQQTILEINACINSKRVQEYHQQHPEVGFTEICAALNLKQGIVRYYAEKAGLVIPQAKRASKSDTVLLQEFTKEKSLHASPQQELALQLPLALARAEKELSHRVTCLRNVHGQPVCWSLDGKPANEAMIMQAAREARNK